MNSDIELERLAKSINRFRKNSHFIYAFSVTLGVLILLIILGFSIGWTNNVFIGIGVFYLFLMGIIMSQKKIADSIDFSIIKPENIIFKHWKVLEILTQIAFCIMIILIIYAENGWSEGLTIASAILGVIYGINILSIIYRYTQ